MRLYNRRNLVRNSKVMDIKEAIKKVVCFENLTENESYSVFNDIMSGGVTPSQISAFITALRMKGETVEEITGAACVMRKKSLKIRLNTKIPVLDTCGTGGSGLNTFNISTAAAFVLSACGVKVAKHGNRSASSQTGSADVLEKLGIKIDASLETVHSCIKTIGIGFLYAPLFHKGMYYAAGPRKEIGIRTIFNILGPLSNPADADCQILGVYDERLVRVMAEVLGKLGVKRAYVVHGADGLDEVTITGRTVVAELVRGKIAAYSITPENFGLKKAGIEKIKGGLAEENADIIKNILSGAKGPKQDIVLMNASVALMAAGKAKDFKQGAGIARSAIDSGSAFKKLLELIEMTNNN